MYWGVTLAITCWHNIYYMLVSLYIDDQWIYIVSCEKVTKYLPLKVWLSLVTSHFVQVKPKTEVILSKSSQWLRIESKSYVSLSPFYFPPFFRTFSPPPFLSLIQSTIPSSSTPSLPTSILPFFSPYPPHSILDFFRTAYLLLIQWAAVRTHLGCINVPPHVNLLYLKPFNINTLKQYEVRKMILVRVEINTLDFLLQWHWTNKEWLVLDLQWEQFRTDWAV